MMEGCWYTNTPYKSLQMKRHFEEWHPEVRRNWKTFVDYRKERYREELEEHDRLCFGAGC